MRKASFAMTCAVMLSQVALTAACGAGTPADRVEEPTEPGDVCHGGTAFADYVPPAGCACKVSWTYAGETYCGGTCGNPTKEAPGPWCFTTAACDGRNWAYCSPRTVCTPAPAFQDWVPSSGCTCGSAWTYAGVTTCGGHCANPDQDPNGPWCYTTATCNGQTWSYCQPRL